MENIRIGRKAVRVYLETRKVAVNSFKMERTDLSVLGQTKISKRIVVFEDRLDENQKAMFAYARDLATSAGLPFEVVDVVKLNILQKLAMILSRNFLETPAVVFPESAFHCIMK